MEAFIVSADYPQAEKEIFCGCRLQKTAIMLNPKGSNVQICVKCRF